MTDKSKQKDQKEYAYESQTSWDLHTAFRGGKEQPGETGYGTDYLPAEGKHMP
jgi:hypothetical protein